MASTTLPALPQPLGLFPGYIAKQNERLIMKGRYVSDSYDITTMAGQPLFTVKDTALSMSHRKEIFDTATNTHICTVRKEPRWFHDNYFIETPDGAHHILDLEASSSGKKNTISFANAMAGGQPTELFFKSHSSSAMSGSIVETGAGWRVAEVDRQHFKLRDEYHVSVPQGMDLVVIIAICVAVDDNLSDSGAVAGGGGGGGG